MDSCSNDVNIVRYNDITAYFFFLKGAYRLDKEYVARRHHGLLVLTILDDTGEIFLAPYSACFMKGEASKMII